MIDEYCGWALAAFGVYFQVLSVYQSALALAALPELRPVSQCEPCGVMQISNGMAVPFPLNVVFLPVLLTETWLQSAVTWVK